MTDMPTAGRRVQEGVPKWLVLSLSWTKTAPGGEPFGTRLLPAVNRMEEELLAKRKVVLGRIAVAGCRRRERLVVGA